MSRRLSGGAKRHWTGSVPLDLWQQFLADNVGEAVFELTPAIPMRFGELFRGESCVGLSSAHILFQQRKRFLTARCFRFGCAFEFSQRFDALRAPRFRPPQQFGAKIEVTAT
jgi:hypothetical protein